MKNFVGYYFKGQLIIEDDGFLFGSKMVLFMLEWYLVNFTDWRL